MALIIGIVAVLIIIFGFLCYKKAPPTEAIVVTGFGLSKPKVVSGKGTFVLPVLQRADKLNMRLLKIDVKTPETGVKTQNGVSLWIDSVVTIQVYSENSTVLDDEVKASGLKDAKAYVMSRQQAAISNFLGMNEQGINDKVNDVLQGNLREIVSDMTVDQILTNRKQMALSVIENARPDLAKMGLEVVTFNVQDIRDAIDAQGHNHGVIEAIGIEQEELVKKQAEIARAQAARDVACAIRNALHNGYVRSRFELSRQTQPDGCPYVTYEPAYTVEYRDAALRIAQDAKRPMRVRQILEYIEGSTVVAKDVLEYDRGTEKWVRVEKKCIAMT